MSSSLPVLNAPTFSGVIPSSKKSFTFRPFLVKEQKILLFALESKELVNIYLALRDIINSCIRTDGKKGPNVDVEKLPIFDLESIFLQIAARSTGEIANVIANCSSCKTPSELEVPLLDVSLKNYQRNANKIQLTDTIGMILKYPTLEDAIKISQSEVELNEESSYDLLLNSIECVYDENNMYKLGEEYTTDDLGVFIDSLSLAQLRDVKEFLKKTPYLSYETKFICPNCGHENEVEIKGIKDFFFVPSPMRT